MKIFTRIVWDVATGAIIESDAFDYDGPIALAMGADVGIATEGLEGAVEPGAESGEEPTVETPDVGVEVPAGEGAEEVPAEGEPAEPVEEGAEPAPEPGKEVLPAQLAKDIRELREAHPEKAPILKVLNDNYYTAQRFKGVYATPEEARADKAAIEALGGHDGIVRMRGEISDIEAFDRLASEGDARVMDGLASEFPDGFKRLVGPALERLSKMDGEAYRDTMRGPLLQMLEGDGLISVIGAALEELKAGAADNANLGQYVSRAQRELGRIAQWYNELKGKETEFRNRYQDPRLKELETREQQLKQRQLEAVETNVRRDLTGYLKETMRPSVNAILKGKTLTPAGRTRFENNVTMEVVNRLRAHSHYGRSLNDLISQGKVEEAVRFAKPFIDGARQGAIRDVYTEMYGNAPAARKSTQQTRQVATGGATTATARASDMPVPIQRKPGHDDIDWNKTPNLLYINGRAYLKSGKFVTWRPPVAAKSS